MKQQCCLCSQASKEVICHHCADSLPTQTHRCQTCALPLDQINHHYCGQCLKQTPIINRTWALYDYGNALPYLIKSFKYHHKLPIGHFFAHKIANAYQSIVRHHWVYDLIIPMPLHPKRIKERGFNQSIELSSQLQKHHPNLVQVNACYRTKSVPAFSGLNKKQRQKHIKNIFNIHEQYFNYKQRILLLDDIMTTGSSINELAKSIKKYQPKVSVDALCLARAT